MIKLFNKKEVGLEIREIWGIMGIVEIREISL